MVNVISGVALRRRVRFGDCAGVLGFDLRFECCVQVTCVYLFHELPRDVRRKVVEEMARVVKPGGLVVLTDSVQLGDRPSMDANIGRFQEFNEPYYIDYINTDIGE